MHIAILGTRGIPNRYGGFEQFAEQLAPGLIRSGYKVTVYCTHHHPFKGDEYKGVQLIRCFDPEPQIGASGQFIYDLNCILDCRRKNFDLIYQLGYTTSGIWQWLMPSKPVLVSNMDGLEWSRAKYSPLVKRLLRWSERAVVQRSDFLIADAVPIQTFLRDTYAVEAAYLAYSATLFKHPEVKRLDQVALKPREFMLVIARMQPDNHVEMIIQGVLKSGTRKPLVVVGDTRNRYGQYLEKVYRTEQIRFIGGIFDQSLLDNLRHFAEIYFHGHSAGGTNPSLLEAMAAGSSIIAHDNPFNRSVLENGARYFSSSLEIAGYLQNTESESERSQRISINQDSIMERYAPENLLEAYDIYFKNCTTRR